MANKPTRITDYGLPLGPKNITHQNSLRSTGSTQKLYNLNHSVLCIILRVYAADDVENPHASIYMDRHGPTHVCDVRMVEDGYGGTTQPINGVIIVPQGPAGLDNFDEQLPRGCSGYVAGEKVDIATDASNTYDLDGDWCVVSFIGGVSSRPYVSNWWPHPRNKFDPQTRGAGNPDESGKGTALKQGTEVGRYFRRVNGIEHVITEEGNIFFSTYYAGSTIKADAKGVGTRGRFGRDAKLSGGSIRVNIKPSQILELSWNEQEDGIGVGNQHDPALPQTNPQVVRPVASGTGGSTFIRLLGTGATVFVPGGISLTAGLSLHLESQGTSDIIVGTRALLDVADTLDVTVGSNSTHTSAGGAIVLEALGDPAEVDQPCSVKYR